MSKSKTVSPQIDGKTFYMIAEDESESKGTFDFECPRLFKSYQDAVSYARSEMVKVEGVIYVFSVKAIEVIESVVEKKYTLKQTRIGTE